MANTCSYCNADATTLKTESRPACAGHGDPPAPSPAAQLEALRAELLSTHAALRAMVDGHRAAIADITLRLAQRGEDGTLYPKARAMLRDVLKGIAEHKDHLPAYIADNVRGALHEMGDEE